MRAIPLAILLLTLLFLSAPAPAPAQDSAAPAPAPAEVDRLITTLEDPAQRDALLAQLKALRTVQDKAPAAEPPPATVGGRVLAVLADRVEGVSQQVAAAGRALIDTPRALRWLESQISDPAKRAGWGALALHLLVIIGAGYGARWCLIWALSRPRRALGAWTGDGYFTRVALVLVRLFLDLLPMAGFALAGFSMLSAADAPRAVRLASLTVLNASLIVQGALVVTRALSSPHSPNLRLLPMSNETAQYLLIWVRRLVIIGVYGYFIGEVAQVLGLPDKAYWAWLKLVGLVVTVLLAVLIAQNRVAVADWMRGPPDAPPVDDSQALRDVLTGESEGHAAVSTLPHKLERVTALLLLRRRLADVWHVLAILYIGAVYGIWALDIAGGFDFVLRATLVTGAILVASRLLAEAVDRLIDQAQQIPDDVKRHYPGLEDRANRYLPLLRRLSQGLIGLFTIVGLLQTWGADALGWFGSNVGQRISTSVVTILIVLALALLLWEVVNGAIQRYLSATDETGQVIRRGARVRTLLPLLRNALTILLMTMVALIVLSELGVNIAPLLAGAGVIGLAIGFGAQTLVKDVITGLFMLIEDTINVGDAVTLGGLGGVVEAMSIRTIRLRGYDGAVHTIPFSAVTTVTNSTKDFSYYVLNVGVDYAQDTDHVVQVLQEIGAEMQADPEYGINILGPVEIAGVDAFQDSAVVIKGRIKARAGQQWAVGREFNRRMKKRFDTDGIAIPFPQRMVHVVGGGTLPAGPAVAAAVD